MHQQHFVRVHEYNSGQEMEKQIKKDDEAWAELYATSVTLMVAVTRTRRAQSDLGKEGVRAREVEVGKGWHSWMFMISLSDSPSRPMYSMQM